MIFTPKELDWIRTNREMIKSILDKKITDIVNSMIYEDDQARRETLRLWAKESKELIIALDNIGSVKPKEQKEKFTGM